MELNKQNFSFIKRAGSFAHAWRGIGVFIRGTHNAWLHIVIFLITVALGFYFDITKIEWTIIILASGFVFVSEAFNTAIEIDMNLTSPEFHPYAKATKDVAAGAVLLSAIFAAAVGVLVFWSYII